MDYTANDFFTVYNLALNNNYQTDTHSIEYQFLLYLSNFFTTSNQKGATAAFEYLDLKQFIATLLLVYNNAFGTGNGSIPAANQNITSALIVPGYRVCYHFNLLI